MSHWRFPFILSVSTLLLFINIQNKRPAYKVTQTPYIISKHLERMKSIQNREDFALSRAFILGDKRSLTKKLKVIFTTLHTNHLFTPSGIHFSSFLIIFLPLIRKCRKRGLNKISLLLEISLCLLPFGLEKFYSLKRISTLRILNLVTKKTKFQLDIFHSFLLTFLFDFIFGTYQYSPMSFTFSFLFLGSLLSTPKLSSIALSFFTANLLLTFFFPVSVSFTGFFLGFLLTSIFSFLFPFLFIFYWLSSIFQFDLTFPFLYIIRNLSEVFFNYTSYSPRFEIDIIGLIFILIYSKKRALRFLIFAIILSSTRISNIPTERIRAKATNSQLDIKNWKINNQVEKGSNDNLNCSRKILRDGHQIRCRKKKRK